MLLSHHHEAGESWSAAGAMCVAALERYRATYLHKARRILDCPALAEDVVQDVLLRILADPPQAEAGTEAAYVGRMVRNLALDRARRRSF